MPLIRRPPRKTNYRRVQRTRDVIISVAELPGFLQELGPCKVFVRKVEEGRVFVLVQAPIEHC